MLQLGLEFGFEGLLRRVGGVEQAPYRAASITVVGAGPDGVAGLEGEVWLNAVDGRKVVVLDFAEFEETRSCDALASVLYSAYFNARQAESDLRLLSHGDVRGSDLLFAAFRRIIDQKINSDVAERGLE